ncbi:hypothetical protein [Absidia glauca]|uniref:Uncharacterized protein n=1 Tax=Absidia glauca TaxID=4829 RepID=A0A163JYB3_ABSGL|nr:hypothetical protein [Absidia glauca]
MSTPIITKGQAACYLYGEDMTMENKRHLKQKLDDNPDLELVYAHDTGMRRPMAIGRKVVARDPLLYHSYPDSDDNDDDINDRVEEVLHSSQESGSSISCEDYGMQLHIHGILWQTMTANRPLDVSKYDRKFVSTQDLVLTLQKHIPNLDTAYNAGQVSRWMCQESNFGKTSVTRTGSTVLNGRMLWVSKKPYMAFSLMCGCMKDMVSLKLFNVNTFRKTIIRKKGWTTIGYARKSKTGDPAKTRQRLIQDMVNALHTKTLCSKVYVSVNCNSSSPLSTRDATPTPASADIQKNLRRINGDFQDLVVYLQTAQTKVRLVVQDFAGLTTNTVDLTAFINKHRMLKEVVVDLGHTITVLSRQELLSGEDRTIFKLRTGFLLANWACVGELGLCWRTGPMLANSAYVGELGLCWRTGPMLASWAYVG